MKKYDITEIFYSLQGEGYHFGTPAIFIRFANCNLNCSFCDTDFKPKYSLTSNEILAEIQQYNCKFIILTGGEPTLQIDYQFIEMLKINGYYIAIETNGTNKVIDGIDWITVSPKTYDIKQKKGNELKLIFDTLKPKHFLNYDFKYWYLQPKSMQNIIELIEYIKMENKWKLSYQMQKILKIQ